MSKKYVIVEHFVNQFHEEIEANIYNNCFFDDKEDAERIAKKLEAEYEGINDYNEVEELSLYHETDEAFIEPED